MALLKRNRSGQNHGQKSETKVAKKLGADQVAGSGSIEGNKGDLHLADHLIECKSTIKDSFSIKLAHLKKIAQEAKEISKTPALHVSFVLETGAAVKDGAWVMMREVDYKHMMGEMAELRDQIAASES